MISGPSIPSYADIMDFVRRANWQQNPEFLPLGTVLTWTIVRNGQIVNVVTTDDGMAGL